MNTKRYCWFVCLSFVLSAGTSLGAPDPARTANLDANSRTIPLTPSVEYLEDPTGQLAYQDVTGASHAGRFRPASAKNGGLNFGFSASVVWLRVAVRPAPSAPQDWILEIAYPLLDRVEVYAPHHPVMIAGDRMPFVSRPVADRNLVFPLRFAGSQTQTIHIRVETQGALTIPLSLWEAKAFFEKSRDEYAALAVYYGILLTLAFYNLVMFFVVSDRAHLLYVGLALSLAVTLSSFNGLANQYLWPGWTDWGDRAVLVGGSLAGVFAILFTRSFLSSKQVSPKLDKALVVLLVLFLALAPAGLWLSYRFVSAVITPALSLLALLVGATCVTSLSSGHGAARWFALAWSLLLFAMVITSLRIFGLLPSNTFTLHVIQVGSAIEMLMFSFALADRLRESSDLAAQAAIDTATARLRQNFVAVFSHEIRNPVASIHALATNLIRLGGNHPPTIADRYRRIRQVAHQVGTLVDNCLTDSQIQNGQLVPNMTAVDIQALISDLIDLEPPGRYELRCEDECGSLHTSGDPLLLRLVFSNLLDNAIKYSPKVKRAEISLTAREGAIEIAVRDFGAGISEKEIALVFEPFYRATPSPGIRGSGLGLWIVKHVLELHNGTIRVVRNEDAGSTFLLRLPQQACAAPERNT